MRGRLERIGCAVAVAAFALAVGPGVLRADQREAPLAPIRALADDLRYDEAARGIPGVLEAGGLSVAETAAAYRLGGELFAAVGDVDQARDYFERWLTLVPDAQLDEGVSPKISAPFEAARARVRDSGPLRVRPVVSRDDGVLRVEVIVDSDPLDMVGGMSVAYGIGDGAPTDQVERSDELAVELEVAEGEAVRLVVAVTDEHGNQLLAKSADVPAGAIAIGASTPGTRRLRPWYARWYTWAGVAGASAGAGVFFGLRARSDTDELAELNAASSSHTFAEAQDVERRAERNALLANVSFGAAGVAAVVAVICGVRGTTYETGATVEPMVTADGGGLSWRVSF